MRGVGSVSTTESRESQRSLNLSQDNQCNKLIKRYSYNQNTLWCHTIAVYVLAERTSGYLHVLAYRFHVTYMVLALAACFLARDSMLSALYAIARPSVRLSVRPSVCHTGGSVKNG